MKRQLILGLSIVLAASLGGCGPTTEEKIQNLFQSAKGGIVEGDYDQAIKDYSEAIKLKPDFVEAWTNRGNAYSNKGNHDQAIKDCSEAIKLKPGSARAWYNRGLAYKRLGNEAKAKADRLKAEELKAKAKSKP